MQQYSGLNNNNIQVNNDTKLTVEYEPKVEALRRHHEQQPKLAFLPYVKCAVAGFLSLLLLGCGVFSKLSVIAVAKSSAKTSANSGRRFIMLVLILMLPQFAGFVSAAWGSLRKKSSPWPTNKAIAVCIVSSIFEVVGLSFFTMIALTSEGISCSELIAVMTCVSMVSTLWQTRKSWIRDEPNTKKRKIFSFICGCFQLAGFVVVIVTPDDENVKHFRWPLIPLLLVSIAWLPKVRKLQSQPRRNPSEPLEDLDIEENEEQLTHPGRFLRMKTARRKATMISEGLKLLLTPFVCYLVAYFFDRVKFSDLANGFEALGKIHDDEMYGYFLTNIFVSFVGYVLGIVTCSMAIQKPSFAMPITLMTPVSFFIAIGNEKLWSSDWLYNGSLHHAITTDKQLIVATCVFFLGSIAQFLSTTYYLWRSQNFIMAKERQLFWVPSYNGVLLEQNLLLNRKNEVTDEYFVDQNKLAKNSCIFICTTMYHEADYEMEQLLHSIRRVDIARQSTIENDGRQENMRRIESHVWFDGAVKRNVLNSYVLQLISLVNKTLGVKVGACTRFETPYGMELRWRLPGGMNFHIHLKDNLKVKNKKRWSQVMYMSYVLDFKIKQMNVLEEDTYILTTDADIMFDADSVEALLNLMIRDPNVGAVCGRTHPLGHGPLVWYQMFDYAIGHWFQKVANHVLGSVLCCPGCFSVYRAKALRDVLSLYSTTADHAVDFLTKDMGEDRWLCTLMVQAGWRLEYCAAAENHTYCPDSFDEFYKQRRRWIPSTLANLALLISENEITVKNNDNVSFLFILYQAANIFSTLISPATVILILVGGLEYGWEWNHIAVLIVLLLVTAGYGLICLYTSQDFQLKTAKVLTLVFSLLMSAAFIGLLIQIVENPEGDPKTTAKPSTTPHSPYGPTNKTKSFVNFAVPTGFNADMLYSKLDMLTEKPELFAKTPSNKTTASHPTKENVFNRFSPSAWYFYGLVSLFILTALCHPTEAGCLVHGIWYLLCLPSGYLFLIIYSVCNLTDRSWGTRENKAKTDSEESLWKMITDKLIWICRGCKDPVQEPAAEPVRPVSDPVSEVTTSSESTESDVEVDSSQKDQSTDQTSGEISRQDSDETSDERSSSSTLSQRPLSPVTSPSRPKKSALKKERRSSASAFRFPGDEVAKSVHFQAKLPTFKTHTAVADWLEGKMKQYIPNFKANGYDDTSFIAGMNDQDLQDIGVEIRGHRKKLLREIEQLPFVELDHNVPDSVDKWLSDLGLSEYWLKFKENSYDYPKALEDLKVMSCKDLADVLRKDLGITKPGHVKKLTQAVHKLQYPSALERKIKEARHDISKVDLRKLKDDGEGDDKGVEYEFWMRLRELRLLPESKAFGQHSELADKLADLRNSAVLCMLVANAVWLILIVTLTERAELKVEGTNPLGLAFLVVFGFIIFIQFLTMLWHRVSTSLHFLARAPFRAGQTSLKGWAFRNDDLPPPPSEEDLRKVREKRLRHSRRWRSSRELLLSIEERSGEHQPLINGRPVSSYGANSPRPRSPHPV